MKLVSMMRPKPEVQETKAMEPAATDSYYEKWPWGLRLTLNAEELDKLGLDLKNLSIDEEVTIQAKAKIVEIRQVERSDEGRNGLYDNSKSLELQVTDLALANEQDFEGAFNEATEE